MRKHLCKLNGVAVMKKTRGIGDAARSGPKTTGVMGSSLGGVVSFYMGWQWPQVFGNVGCLPSTFTHKDNLVERVLQEERRDVRFYLDSGWPGDNYEVGLAMAMALAERGYRYGLDFMYFAFPNAQHSEMDWGQRLHVPFQFFAGRPAVVSRLRDPSSNGERYSIAAGELDRAHGGSRYTQPQERP